MSSPHESLNQKQCESAGKDPVDTPTAQGSQPDLHKREAGSATLLEQRQSHTENESEQVTLQQVGESNSSKGADGRDTTTTSINPISLADGPEETGENISCETARLSERVSAPTSGDEVKTSLGIAENHGADDRPSDPPPPPPKDSKYLPNSQAGPNVSERDPEKEALQEEDMEYAEDDAGDGNPPAEDDDSRSEIQSIMEQFQEGMGAPGEEEIMSPRLEKAGPMLGSPVLHPPRKSSLEPILQGTVTSLIGDDPRRSGAALKSPPPRSSSLISIGSAAPLHRQSSPNEPPESPITPQTTRNLPPLPQPDPEPDLPFDFHRFMEQLRHRTADPVAKFLRSFLLEFGKRQWMVHEQVKIISDFLEFITKKMAQCEVWRTVSDAEFDNAKEGMEKLVTNRLYTQIFSPAIPPPEPIAGPKGKRKTGQGPINPTRPGRRGQHQEDVERDEVLAQKVRIYGWVKEEHLDIKPIGDKGRNFLSLAQQELLKIKSYRAPRDKVICVLNCCKVIFGVLRNSQHDQSADSFIPLLIYVVLKANPDHLVSNVQYILRFRNQDKLGGEAGYYISSLMGVIQFIENLDRTSLTVSDDEFEKNVEAAVSAIAERHSEESSVSQGPAAHIPVSEKSAPSQPEITTRNSLEAERIPLRQSQSQRNGSKSEDDGEDNAAVTGLLRTIQRPLSTIGRIFSEDSSQSLSQNPAAGQPASIPQPGRTRTPRNSDEPRRSADQMNQQQIREEQQRRVQKLSSEDAAARQASAEAEQARKIRAREESHVVETLCGMFPGLDREVIHDVVRANEGRVGSAVDACLALSS